MIVMVSKITGRSFLYCLFLFIVFTFVNCLHANENNNKFHNGSIDSASSSPSSSFFINETASTVATRNASTRALAITIPKGHRNEFIGLDRLFDVWSPQLLVTVWKEEEVNSLGLLINCQEDVYRYLHGLTSGSRWAFGMLDASGRYTSGMFSGNRYWLGASDQCRQMDSLFVPSEERLQEEDNTSEVPPFRVSVYSAKIELTILESNITGDHKITLGLCMPASCRPEDVARLLRYSTSHVYPNLPRQVTIGEVRNASEGYNLFEDPVFYVILIIFIVVILIVIIGTSYDVMLRYRVLVQKEMLESSGNESAGAIGLVDSIPSKAIPSNVESFTVSTIAKLWSIKNHNGSLDVSNDRQVPKPMSEALLSFSLLLNISKLASFDVGSDTLAPIHGLRFISMLWIIMVHTCLNVEVVSDNNIFRSKAEKDFLYQTISNGSYAVDTFFFISGCLVSFLYFRTISKRRISEKKITQGFIGKIMQFLGMIFYRYFRLTPIYLLVIGLLQLSMQWYQYHSVIVFDSLDYENCKLFWWRNALYINTYFDMDERCMIWSWYLSNDTQFYTVGIIILIVGASCLSVGAAIGILVLIASWLTTAVVALKTHHIPTIQDPFAHYESLYDKPWSRIGPYLIGMATGWYLYRIDCKIIFNRSVTLLGWSFSLSTLIAIVYGLYGENLGSFLSALYTTFSHSGWALALAFILTACVTGNGGVVEKILSWKYLYPLSRLTYCVYLVHPAIMRSMFTRGETTFHLTQGLTAILFLGITISSFAVSLVLSLLFEAPMVSLLRIVHPMRRWKHRDESAKQPDL